MMNTLQEQAKTAAEALIKAARPQKGDILVVGCSTSEVLGEKIGSASSTQAAEALFAGIYPVVSKHGLFLAAQCCEHLNRAIVVQRQCALQYGLEPVNVVPQPKAGGSFATRCYNGFDAPCVVEHIRAHLGMDIGNTLIGMHLKEVAVPLRLSVQSIGQAPLVCARTRPKFIGGVRAHYDETLL